MANKKAAAAKGKAKAEVVKSTAQPGVIKLIMDTLTDAKKHKKGVTAGDILAKLTKAFPERQATGMMITVRAQLSRLPKERDFDIVKERDGQVVRYRAA